MHSDHPTGGAMPSTHAHVRSSWGTGEWPVHPSARSLYEVSGKVATQAMSTASKTALQARARRVMGAAIGVIKGRAGCHSIPAWTLGGWCGNGLERCARRMHSCDRALTGGGLLHET